MDDKLKTKSSNDTSGVQANGQSITGTPNKEVERPVSDFLKPSETSPVLDKELQEAGVEVVSEKPELTEEHEQIGVAHSGENVAPSLAPKGKVVLPMTKEEAEAEIAKDKGNINSDIGEHRENIYVAPSALFLARLMIKHLKRIGRRLIGKLEYERT